MERKSRKRLQRKQKITFKSIRRLYLSLLLVLLTLLTGCGTVLSSCPCYPIAGAKVAEELETLEELGADKYNDLFEWIGRVSKMRDLLGTCED